MDIGSNNSYPSNALSNFSPHRFILDGVECNSMEGFLQSLKFKDIETQKYVCSLVGLQAKYKGKHKKWWQTQILYWQGVEYKRNSKEYQELLKEHIQQCVKILHLETQYLQVVMQFTLTALAKTKLTKQF